MALLNLMAVFLYVICLSSHVNARAIVSKEENRNQRNNFQGLSAQEYISDKYYERNKKNRFIRGTQINLDYLAIDADYPCIYGSTVLGNFSANKVDDGHKYSCGIQRIRGEPVV